MYKRPPLTDKQKIIFEFIEDRIKVSGSSPSVREICEATGVRSTSTIHFHLENLEKKGYIRRENFKNRSIEIINDPQFDDGVTPIPVLGQSPISFFASENIEEYLPIPNIYLEDNSEYFVFRILGESMNNCGILNRDLVLVKKQSVAVNGDIIIAILDGRIICKRFFHETDGNIRLHSENLNYKPIFVKEIHILGKLVGLFRSI